MIDNELSTIMSSAIMVVVRVAAPILLLGMAVGVTISIFQAATQINEQTITFVPKLIVIAVVLLLGGSWMLQTLVDFTRNIFDIMLA